MLVIEAEGVSHFVHDGWGEAGDKRTTSASDLLWTADSPETYPVLDPVTTTLVDRREALTVSWFASAGSFANRRRPPAALPQ